MFRVPRVVGQKVEAADARTTERTQGVGIERCQAGGQELAGTGPPNQVGDSPAELAERGRAMSEEPPVHAALPGGPGECVTNVRQAHVEPETRGGSQQMAADMDRIRVGDEDEAARHQAAFPACVAAAYASAMPAAARSVE